MNRLKAKENVVVLQGKLFTLLHKSKVGLLTGIVKHLFDIYLIISQENELKAFKFFK